MSDKETRINEFAKKMEALRQEQERINIELRSLQKELYELKVSESETEPVVKREVGVQEPVTVITVQQPERPLFRPNNISNQKLEDFIGTDLISKIGILITIVGVFIGAKYAIDKELISPLMRIILGYASGAALLMTAFHLKIKYENFSAVLAGGGLAVLYFITYISYAFYQWLPQGVSFLLMVAITVAAVLISLWYNQKIIAILGQVAAYAIPFLLSDGSGKVLILFSYISIINIGLLILSFRKDWKILYRIAFFVTWLIYSSWIFFKAEEFQFNIGLTFLVINFLTFYFTFLSYKVIRKELYNVGEIAVLLLNALLFFFLGFFFLKDPGYGPHMLTWFTIVNAAIHFMVGKVMFRLKLADDSVYQFITGLGILFITIAVPVELDGNWVTLLWAIEAAILCHVAFKNNRGLYLNITIPMLLIACISLLQDWDSAYPHLNNSGPSHYEYYPPLANLNFLFSLVVIICFGYICRMASTAALDNFKSVWVFFKVIMPFIFFSGLYCLFFNEIHFAWDRYITADDRGYIISGSHVSLQKLSLMVYSFLYVTAWLLAGKIYQKAVMGTGFLLFAAVVCAGVFLFIGLFEIGELRENYLAIKSNGNSPPFLFLYVRYLCIGSLALLVWSGWKALEDIPGRMPAVKIFSIIFNVLLLSVLCNEFIHMMQAAGYPGQYTLGLSIICGLYALVLVFVGIKTGRKHLRVSAIVLFGITLIKLFFYDLSSLSTVSKTLVLVILGIILLLVSFLYNKYKAVILGDDDELQDIFRPYEKKSPQ